MNDDRKLCCACLFQQAAQGQDDLPKDLVAFAWVNGFASAMAYLSKQVPVALCEEHKRDHAEILARLGELAEEAPAPEVDVFVTQAEFAQIQTRVRRAKTFGEIATALHDVLGPDVCAQFGDKVLRVVPVDVLRLRPSERVKSSAPQAGDLS